MGDFPPYDSSDEDDDDGLSALNYSYGDDASADDSSLDALGGYPAGDTSGYSGGTDGYAAADEIFGGGDAYESADDHGAGLDALDEEEEDEAPAVPLFVVANPPGTVTVTTFMDGRVQRIELSPKVVDMTEADLAEEIRVVADLAADEARSAQYSVMLEGLRRHGHDDVATRDFLTRDMGLPSPEQVDATRAQIFSTRYGVDHG